MVKFSNQNQNSQIMFKKSKSNSKGSNQNPMPYLRTVVNGEILKCPEIKIHLHNKSTIYFNAIYSKQIEHPELLALLPTEDFT